MRRRPFLSSLGLLGLLLAPAACKQSDSILLIEVAGPRTATFVPVQLSVTVNAGFISDARNFLVPPVAGEPIVLPASFTLALDRSLSPPITVSINAIAADHSPIGYGTTVQDHIQIGGQTVISVMLMEGLPPDTVDAGAGGSGAGGASGQGGASGRDGASADASKDALGLDGATD